MKSDTFSALPYRVIEHENSLPKMAPQNTNIPQNGTVFSPITHTVEINTAVSRESTYCPLPSSVSLLRPWSNILGCKFGPHFVAKTYEFIHDQNTRRACASKFILTSVTPA